MTRPIPHLGDAGKGVARQIPRLSGEQGVHRGGYGGLKAPFPWFGGKSRVAHIVWEAFGNCDNYVEPFAGSLAVLLARPHAPQTETVNDLDCYLANFWRATAEAPEEVAQYADWPVNEADLHARHLWLVNQTEFRERMKTDPDYYDAKIAGWWVWGISMWIGSGWCSRPDWSGRGTAIRQERGVHAKHPMCSADNAGKGVHAASAKRPALSGNGHGVGVHSDRGKVLIPYFEALATRLRRVRVCCGDWQRVLGPSVTIKHGFTGILLDPPYDMRAVAPETKRSLKDQSLYNDYDNDISAAVRAWAIENGDNPLLRIALCGYEGEHDMPDTWETVKWSNRGGYRAQGGDTRNADRQRIWLSPHCLSMPLFR